MAALLFLLGFLLYLALMALFIRYTPAGRRFQRWYYRRHLRRQRRYKPRQPWE